MMNFNFTKKITREALIGNSWCEYDCMLMEWESSSRLKELGYTLLGYGNEYKLNGVLISFKSKCSFWRKRNKYDLL